MPDISDHIIASDPEGDGVGDIIFATGGKERARIKADGTGTGWPAVIGGSLPALAPRSRVARPQWTMITDFRAGHGYTAAGTFSSSNLNDTSTFLFDTQCATLTSSGGGVGALLRKLAQPVMDFTDKDAIVWIACDAVAHLRDAQLYLGDTGLTNFFALSLFTAVQQEGFDGEWVPFGVSFSGASITGTPNRAAITDIQLRFSDDNTGNNVTVHWGGVASTPEPTGPFPNGVASINGDDGYPSQYTDMRPYLDKCGFAATFYPVIDFIGNGGFTLAQAQEMKHRHGHRFGAHSFTTADHNAAGRLGGLSADALDFNLRSTKNFLESNALGPADDFAYPGGTLADFNVATEAVVRKYFRSARLTLGNPRQIWPPADPMRIKTITLNNLTTVASIQTEIDNAYTYRTHLTLVFHELVTSPVTGTQYSIANFQAIMDYLVAKGMLVMADGEVFDTLAAPAAKIVSDTYSASITPRVSQTAPWHKITVTNGTAFTINAPTPQPASAATQEFVIEVSNTSGGAMGVITWNAAFVFAGFVWANPATGKKRYARFEWNGANWICTAVAAADY